MTPIEHASADPAVVEADAVAVLVPEGDLPEDVARLGAALEIDLAAVLKAVAFEGKAGQRGAGPDARAPARTAAAGRGAGAGRRGRSAAAAPRRGQRRAGDAARRAPGRGRAAVAGDAPDAARAVAEGAGLGAYAFTRYKTKAPEAVALDAIVVVGDAAAEAAVRRARTVVDAIGAARDLVNLGPSDKRPPALAEAYRDLVAGDRVTVEVLDEQALADGGFGGILGVGKGSSRPAPARRDALRARGRDPLGRADRQGHHVRLRWPVAQAGRGHGDDEVRHGRLGGRRRRPSRPSPTSTSRSRSPATPRSPRTCPAASRSAPATSSATAAGPRSRCSTPTPRVAWSWPTRWPTPRSPSPTRWSTSRR